MMVAMEVADSEVPVPKRSRLSRRCARPGKSVMMAAVLAVSSGCAGFGSRSLAQDGAEPPVSSGVSAEELRCMALSMYWEARSEGEEGMVAVGSVVLNRIASPDFPNSVCGVVFEGGETPPCQFSWWCDGTSDRPTETQLWTLANAVATRLLTDAPADPTNGALFFHSTGIDVPWRVPRTRTARIRGHVYYR